ncbi:MAG: DUF2268 domain-containing putative Zn-dependent protease [Steroidobacteraceae bacterium]
MPRVICASLVFATPAFAATADPAAHILDVDNRVGKFEKFYGDATAKPMDGTARFQLWQKEDGLAAVPPGPDGEAMARKLLDDAWDKYPALVSQLPVLTKTAADTARIMFAKDNAILETANDPIHSRLILYVGQFDNNAFTMPAMDGRPVTVLMSVENTNLKLILAHELTHSIHLQLAHVKNSFGAPVGETMFLEGLAMRTAQRAVPGLPDAAYVAMPGDEKWFLNCMARKEAVLRGIARDLKKGGREIAIKYTFGQGNTGMQRESYCAAWIVMGQILNSGETLPQLARIPEGKMVSTISSAMKDREKE